MQLFDPSQFADCLIEQRDDCHTFLIPPERFSSVLPWLGVERARAFSALSPYASTHSDLDERDSNYWHMLLWDQRQRQLIGGQRMLFVAAGAATTEHNSYLEHCHPGLATTMLNAGNAYAEVGRTFVAPRYQRGIWLKELIRGFVRIPEARGIHLAFGMLSFNHLNLSQAVVDQFVDALDCSLFRGDLLIPPARFPYSHQSRSVHDFGWDGQELVPLEIQLRLIDPAFSLPPVLRPYRALCSVEYESATIARSYNQILQLLFSGRSELITRQQRRRLAPYPGLTSHSSL